MRKEPDDGAEKVELRAEIFTKIFSTVDLLLLRSELDLGEQIEPPLTRFLESIEDFLRSSSDARVAFKQVLRDGGLNALLALEEKENVKVFLISYFAISVTENYQGWEVIPSDEEEIAKMFETFLPTITDLFSQTTSTPVSILRRLWSSLIMLASHESISKFSIECGMMSNISSVLEQSPDIEITKMVLEFVWDVTLLGASRGQMIKHRGLISVIEELTQNANEEVSSMAKNVIWSLKTPKEKGESYASKNSAKRGKHKWLIIYTLSISVLVLSVVLYACFSSSRPLGPQKGTRAKSLQNMELYSRDNKMMKQEEEISERQERIGGSLFSSDLRKWFLFFMVSIACHALLALLFKLLSKSVKKAKKTTTAGRVGAQQPNTGTDVPHVMISYCWAQQKVALDLQARLEDANIKVWIDVNEMHGFLAERMSEAVENSYAVIMLLSSDYNQSFNCKSEANYSHFCRKTIIPLIAQRGFVPSKGWLSFIIAGKLYYQGFDSRNLEENFPQIMAEVQRAREM
ncbi:uncharacterized protein LOC142349854 isoform X2 [Convolutriloba macropyga]